MKTHVLVFFLFVFFGASNAIGQEYFDDILDGFDESTEIEKRSTAGKSLEDQSLEDILSGFAVEDQERTPAELESLKLPAWLRISGSVSLGSSFNHAHKPPASGEFDHRGLSRFKTAVDFLADAKLYDAWSSRIELKGFYDFVYDIQGREEFSSQVLTEYSKELEFGEVWLRGSLTRHLDLKAGRQIVVWGKSDNIRVTDILNPLDNREPGLTDIRDLRLPVTMTKFDWYSGHWNYSAMVIHEIRFNKNPVFGKDFYPGTVPAPPEEEYSVSTKNQEFAVAANGVFSGWDLSLYGAHVIDDTAHLEMTATGTQRFHSRITMAGAAVNLVSGSWLLKGEAAYLHDLEFSQNVGRKSRGDILIGAEYSGIAETVLSVEAANRHIFSFDDRLRSAPDYLKENELQFAFRGSREFFNDTLILTGLAVLFDLDGNGGAFERLTLEYELSSAITASAGVIFYQAGNKAAFRDIGENDRLFGEIRYFF